MIERDECAVCGTPMRRGHILCPANSEHIGHVKVEYVRASDERDRVREMIDSIERVQYLHGTRCGDFKAALDAVRAALNLEETT